METMALIMHEKCNVLVRKLTLVERKCLGKSELNSFAHIEKG